MSLAMDIALAKDDQAAWDLMRDNHKAFVWTDDEEPEETWNRLATNAGSKLLLTVAWGQPGDLPTLELGDKRYRVPLSYTREDRYTIIPHSIAQIGKDILEMRYCRASAHGSDQAYLPCSPSVWRSLEAEFGVERVARQFQSLPDDLDEFIRMAGAPYSPQS